jgi:hypothetical protein
LKACLDQGYYSKRDNDIYRDYPGKENFRERSQQYAENKRIFRSDLEQEYGIAAALKSGHLLQEKADRLFDLAWEYGHSSGYNEVNLHYSELVDLVL